jgi:hypothetical protein
VHHECGAHEPRRAASRRLDGERIEHGIRFEVPAQSQTRPAALLRLTATAVQ